MLSNLELDALRTDWFMNIVMHHGHQNPNHPNTFSLDGIVCVEPWFGSFARFTTYTSFEQKSRESNGCGLRISEAQLV